MISIFISKRLAACIPKINSLFLLGIYPDFFYLETTIFSVLSLGFVFVLVGLLVTDP
jgi:hypothetical protein